MFSVQALALLPLKNVFPFFCASSKCLFATDSQLQLCFSPCRDTYNTYQSGSGKASQPRWILVIGAFGIVFGLAMYGYRIIATLGVDLVVMTPSRGYSVELAGAAIIALASTYGLPVSTTQVIVSMDQNCCVDVSFSSLSTRKCSSCTNC